MEIKLDFTDNDITKLWNAGCKAHLYLQPDRYESDSTDHSKGLVGKRDPLIKKLIEYEKNNEDRSMLWVDGNHLDAMIIKKYYQEKYRADAHILWDLTDYGGYVIWVNRSLDDALWIVGGKDDGR
tara:strand:- start:18 stop:392 length:375 start_codon:yes stop_codon:yes gene_type:complete